MTTTHTDFASHHVYAVVITPENARPGYPAGVWTRLLYRALADACVARLAAEGIPAVVVDEGQLGPAR